MAGHPMRDKELLEPEDLSKQVPGPSACRSPDHPDYKDSPWHTVSSNLGSLWGAPFPESAKAGF